MGWFEWRAVAELILILVICHRTFTVCKISIAKQIVSQADVMRKGWLEGVKQELHQQAFRSAELSLDMTICGELSLHELLLLLHEQQGMAGEANMVFQLGEEQQLLAIQGKANPWRHARLSWLLTPWLALCCYCCRQ